MKISRINTHAVTGMQKTLSVIKKERNILVARDVEQWLSCYRPGEHFQSRLTQSGGRKYAFFSSEILHQNI